MHKLLIGAASLAMLAAPVAASAQPFGHAGGGRAFAGRDYGRRDGDRGGGAAVAAGLFGFILGSAIADAGHSYAYDQPYGYAPNCGWQTQAYYDVYGGVHYRQVEVCN